MLSKSTAATDAGATWTFRRASEWLKASRSLGTARFSKALFVVLLASGILRFLWSLTASTYFGTATSVPKFGAVWYVVVLAFIAVGAAGTAFILATVRSWVLVPLAWAALVALLFIVKQVGLSYLLMDALHREMAAHSVSWRVALSIFVGVFIPIMLVSAGTRFLGGRLWVFLLGGFIGNTLAQIPFMIRLLSGGTQRWDIVFSSMVDGLLWGGGLYVGLLVAAAAPKNHEEKAPMRSKAGALSQAPPEPTPDEQRAKDVAATDQKVIGACAFAGGAFFFILNFTTGLVPGGAIGGAIGGGLGAAVGMVINALRGR